jgi:translocation and assembly module TamB
MPDADTAPPTPVARRRRLWPIAVPALLALLLALAGAGWWLWRSEAGTAWLLQRVPGLQASGVAGRASGGPFSIERLQWQSGGTSVRLEGLSWQDAQWRLRPYPGAWLGLELVAPRVRRVEVRTAEGKDEPRQPPPADLRLPLELVVRQAHVGSLQVNDLPEATDIAADLHLGDERGGSHRLERLEVRAQGVQAKARARAQATDDLRTEGTIELATLPQAGRPWQASARLDGTLRRLGVDARVNIPGAGPGTNVQGPGPGPDRQGAGSRPNTRGAGPPPSTQGAGPGVSARGAAVDAQATLTPFEPWPLAALQARVHDLDLSTLAAGLPRTRLSGRAEVDSTGLDAPVTAKVELANAAPGAWNDGALPLRSAGGVVHGRMDRRELQLDSLQLLLGDAQGEAGRMRGTAGWRGHALTLELALEDVQPARLDSRAARMTIGGPVRLALNGLPAPGTASSAGAAAGSATGGPVGPVSPGSPNAPSASTSPTPPTSPTSPTSPASPPSPPSPPSPASASAPPTTPSASPVAGAPSAASASSATGGLSGELHAELAGTLGQAASRDVRVLADGQFRLPADGSLRATLARFEARAGDARARFSGEVQRSAQQRYRLHGQGDVDNFDPSVWWTGIDERWRRGPHSLGATWTFDVAVPASALSAPPLDMLRALAGEASVRLNDSRVAGVALQGTASLRAGDDDSARLESSLRVGGNQLAVQADLAPPGGADRARARVDANALAALQPLARLFPELQRWMPSGGSVRADVAASGRWPRIDTQGELHVRGLQGDGWGMANVDATWNAATGNVEAPLQLKLEAGGLAQGERRIDRLEASLQGTLGAHRLDASARSPLRPPAWTDQFVAGGGAPPGGGTLRLSAQGGWQPQSAGGGAWLGRIAELVAAPPGRAATPWLEMRDVQGRIDVAGAGGVQQASLQPGRIEILGATLQWREARYRAATAPGRTPDIALDARLDPLNIAPLLARLQPQFGWGGNLTVQGRADIGTGETFAADVVLERASGDLTITDETGTRALGLTDLRLALVADRGTWHLTQAMAGRNLGILGGAQTVRVAADATWPPLDAPLEGALEMRVDDLSAWGAWLPPGWRLGGRLRTSAAIGGRLGAPRYTGEIAGSDMSVRNLLEGVHLRDGQLSVALRGENANFERFVFRSGEGTLSVGGNATFGAAPQAQLQITAEDFLAIDRLDRRVVLSGNADVRLRERQVSLRGRLAVDEGFVDISQGDAPQLDGDVIVVNRPASGAMQGSGTHAGTPPTAETAKTAKAETQDAGPLRDADVSLHVDLGESLHLRGRGLRARLTGQLHVTTPQGEPHVEGIVHVRSGTYKAYGQNLAVERGIISFDGDVSMPRLDILAVRPDVDVKVGVSVQGNAADPRIALFSEPEMSEMDKLSWLVMGRASEGLGGDDTALLQRAALALLAGEDSGESESIVQSLGLDTLSVRQGESGDVQGTIVSLGKQLSKRLYLGYERGLNAAGGSWQLIYRIAQRFNLRAQSGEESAVDVVRTWRWN